MRKAKDTIPVDPFSLTQCSPCLGRAHLRCDCPLLAPSETLSDWPEDEVTEVKAVKR